MRKITHIHWTYLHMFMYTCDTFFMYNGWLVLVMIAYRCTCKVHIHLYTLHVISDLFEQKHILLSLRDGRGNESDGGFVSVIKNVSHLLKSWFFFTPVDVLNHKHARVTCFKTKEHACMYITVYYMYMYIFTIYTCISFILKKYFLLVYTGVETVRPIS